MANDFKANESIYGDVVSRFNHSLPLISVSFVWIITNLPRWLRANVKGIRANWPIGDDGLAKTSRHIRCADWSHVVCWRVPLQHSIWHFNCALMGLTRKFCDAAKKRWAKLKSFNDSQAKQSARLWTLFRPPRKRREILSFHDESDVNDSCHHLEVTRKTPSVISSSWLAAHEMLN